MIVYYSVHTWIKVLLFSNISTIPTLSTPDLEQWHRVFMYSIKDYFWSKPVLSIINFSWNNRLSFFNAFSGPTKALSTEKYFFNTRLWNQLVYIPTSWLFFQYHISTDQFLALRINASYITVNRMLMLANCS